MIRALCMIGGLVGGVSLSQYPEFSQQYLQRLAGQVEALTVVAKDFDTSALTSGLGREEALQQLSGAPFLEDRQADMRRTFARHARLSENLMLLRNASPMERLTLPHRMADTATLQGTWADYKPAVPVTMAGGVSAGAGFLGGWAIVAGLLAAVAAPFRRRRNSPVTQQKKSRNEPSVARPSRPALVLNQPNRTPSLMGERR